MIRLTARRLAGSLKSIFGLSPRFFAAAMVTVVSMNLISCAHADDPELFGIYTSTLDGKDFRKIVNDPNREVNHARVSPDKEWITFTRYNKRGPDGLALEIYGYEESEIMLCRADGSDLKAIVPPEKGTFAANGYWTPDGKGIIYIGGKPSEKTQLKRYDIATGEISVLPGPKDMWLTDPHQVGDQIVFPAQNPQKKKKNAVWIMDKDGKNARQLTDPAPGKEYPKDYDPKLSPDGSKVAVMREMGKDNWHIIIVDVKTGKETDLSEPVAVDGVPEWSSDGKLLIFWHVNPKDIRTSGLYVIRPDGKGRERLPIPRGYFYTMPAFFPDEGSGNKARIIYSGRKNPLL